MKLQKINYDKITKEIELRATKKALQKILSTKVEIKKEDNKIGFKIGNKTYYETNNLCSTLFSSVLMNILEDRHGDLFCWYDFNGKVKANDIFEKYERYYKLKFLKSNYIDGTPEEFKKAIKTHILKRYGL